MEKSEIRVSPEELTELKAQQRATSAEITALQRLVETLANRLEQLFAVVNRPTDFKAVWGLLIAAVTLIVTIGVLVVAPMRERDTQMMRALERHVETSAAQIQAVIKAAEIRHDKQQEELVARSRWMGQTETRLDLAIEQVRILTNYVDTIRNEDRQDARATRDDVRERVLFDGFSAKDGDAMREDIMLLRRTVDELLKPNSD